MADSAFEIAWSLALLDVVGTAHQDCSVFHWTLFLACCIGIVFSPSSKASGALGFCVRHCGDVYLAMTQISLQIATTTISLQSVYSAVNSDGTYTAHWDSLQRMDNILGFVENFLLATNTQHFPRAF
ncbi:hypothetical protein K438DRAFT_1884895, partial [Mycena galopus ATCC 62051]